MLQLEQPVAVGGVAFGLFQPVEHGELPADEVLAALAEVGEDVVHAAPQQGLLPGEPHGRRVHRVERPRHLPDLLVGVHPDRFHAHVRDPAVDERHPGDRRGQPRPGDLERRAAQRAQRNQQRAGHDDEHGHGHQHQQRDEHAVAHGGGPGARRQGLTVGREPELLRDLDVADQLGRPPRGAVPVGRQRGGQRLAGRERGEHPLLDALPGVHVGPRDRGRPAVAQRRRRRGQLAERRRRLRRGGPGGVLQRRRRRARHHHGGHGGVLAADLLLRPRRRSSRRPRPAAAVAARRSAPRPPTPGMTSMTAVYAAPTRSAGNAEPVTARRSAARSASRSRAAASRSGRRAEPGGRQRDDRRRGRVDLPELGVERPAALRPRRDVGLGEHPLALQRIDQPSDLLTRGDLPDQRVEGPGVLARRRDAQGAERADHEQRDDEHRGQLRAQPPVPQSPAAPTAADTGARDRSTVAHPPAVPAREGRMVPRPGASCRHRVARNGHSGIAAGPTCVRIGRCPTTPQRLTRRLSPSRAGGVGQRGQVLPQRATEALEGGERDRRPGLEPVVPPPDIRAVAVTALRRDRSGTSACAAL